ncbi:MAG: exonuclease SbcCD subunit D [Veillonella dispar]|uniref:exonuclease SbcCD subunit D n=1 Tax=Veillonella dispar TaxID=39778 RepID=UPI00280B0054|nr:exonuclease SbcCD subunit D [Veillonella dispar]MDU4877894.1 exonuclease SbcCD subunit D [Veillonella dispar]MDU4886698.1 exonuclease SbcCD subunit D [Veillonella dispar]MDU6960235.1 exonuclease SbcCD subunit D [Veillonella dispar]
MRFLHTADWHLGRIFYGQYLTEDQAHVLENQFFSILKDEKIDGILLAGDIFDRAVPPVEAIELWDSIITRLAMDYKVPLFVVSGNHDGAERLEVGRSMLSRSGIHIWGSPHHALQPFEFEGADGKVAICPMPFSEPRRIGDALGLGSANNSLQTIQSLENAIDADTKTKAKSKRSKSKKASVDIIEDSLFASVDMADTNLADVETNDVVTQDLDRNNETTLNLHNYDQMYQAWSDYLYKQVPKGMRSIAISHAFVMGGDVGGSERTLSVGGSEQVSPQVFKDFHYTALGHLHGPQRMGADYIRYSGSPLKYSFDEHTQKKSFTIIDMDKKGNVDISTIPVEAKRDVVILEGYFEDLLNNKELQAKHKDDYVQARLLDTMPIMDGMAKLRQVYHRCMTIDLVGRVATPMADMDEAVFKELNERQLFNQFAETVWKEPLTEREQQYINSVWDRILKED